MTEITTIPADIQAKMINKPVDLPEPFLGRLVLEVIQEDSEAYLRKTLGMENSVLAIPDMLTEGKNVPYTKGVIVKMAPDSFGERFKKNYGSDGVLPTVGDTVLFVRNQGYNVDPKGQYQIIADEQIIGFYKKKGA